VRPPRLLLLDEPVSALDPANRERALELVASLTAHGVAVLAVFHDADAMRRLADRVVELGSGRVRRHGAPAELLGSAA
jgi:alpha-D-ribose 1-methylphosphonate 5-triphosphate synthase subunit PhnL